MTLMFLVDNGLKVGKRVYVGYIDFGVLINPYLDALATSKVVVNLSFGLPSMTNQGSLVPIC